MSIWFTSDQHFGHTNIIRYCQRPFETVNEMDAEIVRRWNLLVAPNDLVLVVGDFSFRKEEETSTILASLNGAKLLVRGNHDDRKTDTYWRRVGFRDVVDYYHVVLDHIGPVYVKHEPEPYNSPHKRQINGHVHEKWKTKRYVTTDQRYVNVGVDQWAFGPVSTHEIITAFQDM